MSWSNIGNPSQDPVTTNFPNPVGFQTTHSTFNIPPIQIPPTPTTPAIPSIPTIPSFEQVLASTLQQNNIQTSNLLPSFSTFLPQLPPQTMNPYDSRSYPNGSTATAWARPYGIAYTPAPQRTTTQTSPTNGSTPQYYSVIPAKRVHPETNRSDRYSSDSRYANDNSSSRHYSSRGGSSSDRNHYDSSKRHRSGSERSSTSSLRPSSSNYTSSGSSGVRRSEHGFPIGTSRTSTSHGSQGSSRSASSSQSRHGNVIPPLPPPPPIAKQGVLNNINGRVTIDRFQEYARLVGSYPYVRDLLHDIPSQFELSNEPAYQAIFELSQPSGAPRLLMKRVSVDLPEEVYSQIKNNTQLRVHMRTFALKNNTTEHSWPQSTQLTVNNNVISIVSKANDKKLQDLPADITPYCRPGVNFIDFTSYPQEHHVAAIQVVRLIPAEELFNNKKQDVQPYDAMFQKVLDFFHAGVDSEIAATKTKVSFIDSLSLQKIQYPARASTCLPHLQCFDLYSYIMANYKMGKWLCPVCSKKASYKNLFVDSYTQRILTELAEQQKLSSTREIEIYPDGTWNRVDEDQKKRFESVKLDDFKNYDAQSSPSRSTNAKKSNVIQVINLDSDDEDEDNSYSAPAPSNMNNNRPGPVIKDEFSNGSTNQFSLDDIASAATRELAPIMQEPSYNNDDIHNSSGDFAIDLNAPDLDYFDFGVDQASTYQNNNTTFSTSQYVNTTPTTSSRSGVNNEPIIILDDD